MVLPNPQDARPLRTSRRKSGIQVMNSTEDRISRISNTNKTIFIFLQTILPVLVLLEFIERNHVGTKTQTDQFVPAAYGKHRNSCAANKLREAFKDGFIVIVTLSKPAANYNCIRPKPGRPCRYL